MQIEEVRFTEQPPVDSYGPTGFRIADVWYEGGVVLGPAGVTSWEGGDDRAALLALAGQVDVILFGTGAEIAPVDDDLRSALEAHSLYPEPMASASACRTYNVLLSEGRRVALAAHPIGD